MIKIRFFQQSGAVTEKVEDPYGDNGALELLDITFTIIFAKPMESSSYWNTDYRPHNKL